MYITVDDQIDTDQLAKNISDLATQNNSIISRLHMKLGLQPLSDIHFTTSLGSEVARTEQKSKLFFFGTIAFLIIVFSVINFTTLIFVDQLKGLRNIAVKKTLGSSKRKLFIELLTKSLIFILVAFLVAGSIVELVKPQFVNFTNTNIIETGIGIHGIILMLGIFILAVFIGGLYPNILVSSLSPSFILRTDNRFKTRNLSTRNILLIIQFTVSLILIICTLISLRQLNFMLQHDSGFNRKNIIMVPAREPLVQRFDILKQELLKNPSIDGVTLQSRSFHSGGQDYAHWVGKEEQENVIVDVFAVEHDFCKLLGIEIIEGRDFSKEIITDNTGAFIVNREAADQMGLENPVGKTIFANQRNGEIIGITNNAYFRSLKKDIEPAVFYIYDSFVLPWIYNQGIILVKFREGEEEAVISDLEKFWIKFNQEQPFEYEFLDREFNSMYENEKQNAMLFELFSVIAIIISCLGLYAVI